ncbi:hypothetical protein INR49_017600 [Caranx melampygus]|nr:hypothetical protein INR49_017600 [Caranx melampygus]
MPARAPVITSEVSNDELSLGSVAGPWHPTPVPWLRLTSHLPPPPEDTVIFGSQGYGQERWCTDVDCGVFTLGHVVSQSQASFVLTQGVLQPGY